MAASRFVHGPDPFAAVGLVSGSHRNQAAADRDSVETRSLRAVASVCSTRAADAASLPADFAARSNRWLKRPALHRTTGKPLQ